MTTIPTRTKVYPVRKVAALFVDSAGKVTTDLMWRMQQGVADAKFKILQLMYDEDQVPVAPAEFEWDIQVRGRWVQRTIDGEATNGKWISLPLDMQHLVVAQTPHLREWVVDTSA